MKKITIFLFLMISLDANAIVLGYVTGNDYLNMSEESRKNWLVGVMDGVMAESIALVKDTNGPWLGRCVARYEMQQLKAIFEKELSSNPEGRHAPAAIIFRSRIAAFCNGNN